MSKQRKTVSLDPEVKAYLDSNGRNASETVNKLVKMEMGQDAVNEALLEMRMEMEKSQYKDAAQKARGHLERFNQLKTRLEQQRQKNHALLDDARDALSDVPLSLDNPAVENWADKLDMEPQTLIDEVEE